MNRVKSAALTAIACAALFVAVPGTHAAQGTGNQAGTSAGSTAAGQTGTASKRKLAATTGKITEIATDHVTVQPATGDAKRFALGAGTRFGARSFDAAKAGLKEGDYARVIAGEDNAARSVEFALEPFAKGNRSDNVHFAGTVLSSTSDSLTVRTTGKDPVTVRLLSDTKYFVDGKRVENPPAFKAGEVVRVIARNDADGTLHARIIATGRGKGRHGDRETLIGKITGSGPSTLGVTDAAGNPATISLVASTKYFVDGKLSDTRPSFTNGEKVRALVHQETDGSLTGLVIAVRTK